MITLLNAHMKNFLSFEDTYFEFPQSPLNVQGENRTDDDQESNGSGKSGFHQVAEFGTLGSNSRKERDANLIRNGCKQGETILNYHCYQRHETMMIHRTLKKRGSLLDITINGEPADFATVKDGNQFILNWLGTTKEDFTSYYVIGQERFKSFFSSSNKEKLELVGRLADTSFIDNTDVEIKKDIKELEKTIRDLKDQESEFRGEKKGYENQIETLSISNENTKEDLALSLSDDIEALNEKIVSYETKIKSYEKLAKQLDQELESAKRDVGESEKKLIDTSEVEANLADLRKDRVAELKNKVEAENYLAGEIECPKCEHKFVRGVIVDLTEQEVIAEDCKLLIEYFDSQIAELNERVKEADELAIKHRKLVRVVDSKNNAILDANKDLKTFESRIALAKEDIALKEAKIQQILDAKPTDNTEIIEGLRKSVETCDKELGELAKKIAVKEDELFEVEQWITNFKRFKMHLANQTLSDIQSRCNINLGKMQSDLKVMIDGFKINADGKTKEEITPHVVRDEPRSFFSYSGGERGRVQFAMILAIQDMINSRNQYGGINLLMMDEVLEGMDATGLRYLMKSIKNLGLNAMIITHVTDRKVGSDNLVIEKVCGISRIKEVEV